MMRRGDTRPLERRQTEFGFSYMAPVGLPPPPMITRRGCVVTVAAVLLLVAGIGLIVAGTQYGALLTSLQPNPPSPAAPGQEAAGAAIGGTGALLTGVASIWLLGILALRRRRLRLPLLPRLRRRPPAAVVAVDDDSDLF